MATFLQAVNSAQNEIGLPRSGSAVSSTDPGVQQMAALLNAAGMDLVKEHPWQVLQREHTFSTVSGTATYALPTDYDRFIPDTDWDRTQDARLYNVGPQEWALAKGVGTSTSIYYRWRVRRNQIYLDPTPSGVNTLAIEYISSYWLQSADGQSIRGEAAADDDDLLLDFRLLVDALKLKWYSVKGFDTRDAEAAYKRRLNMARSSDTPTNAIAMDRRSSAFHLIDEHNLRETGYGA